MIRLDGKPFCFAVKCRPGYYSQSGLAKCFSCPHGTYSSGDMNTACTACPTGTTTILPAAAGRQECGSKQASFQYFPILSFLISPPPYFLLVVLLVFVSVLVSFLLFLFFTPVYSRLVLLLPQKLLIFAPFLSATYGKLLLNANFYFRILI